MDSSHVTGAFQHCEVATDRLRRDSELLGQRGDVDTPVSACSMKYRLMTFLSEHLIPQSDLYLYLFLSV